MESVEQFVSIIREYFLEGRGAFLHGRHKKAAHPTRNSAAFISNLAGGRVCRALGGFTNDRK